MKAVNEGIVALTADELEAVGGGWCGTVYPGWWKIGPLPQPDPIFRTTLPVQLEAPAVVTSVATIG